MEKHCTNQCKLYSVVKNKLKTLYTEKQWKTWETEPM